MGLKDADTLKVFFIVEFPYPDTLVTPACSQEVTGSCPRDALDFIRVTFTQNEETGTYNQSVVMIT